MECKNDLVTVEDRDNKINKLAQEYVGIEVPVATSKTKSHAERCKEYRERKKLNPSKEKKPVKSRAQINKTYYEKHKISKKSRKEYMKKYRQKKKFEKRILQLKHMEELKQVLQLQNDNNSQYIHSQNNFEQPRKKHKTKKKGENKDLLQHIND